MNQNVFALAARFWRRGLVCLLAVFLPSVSWAEPSPETAVLVGMEGSVELLPASATNWVAASVGAKLRVGDQLRTGPRSRATVRLSDLSVLRIGELMSYKIEPPRTATAKPTLSFKSGAAYFFSRDKPQEFQIQTPTVTGAIRGTEFNVLVAADGRTTVTMIDGEVELTNRFGSVFLGGGDEGAAAAGKAPVKTAVINAVNVIQWNLYYPGVLDVAELDLTAGERAQLADSLAAYQQGALPEALRKYPADHRPESAADHLYLGALLLSVGLVDQALSHLDAAAAAGGDLPALANALRQVVASVKFETGSEPSTSRLATEFLSESYYRQSRGDLPDALKAARKAVEKAPAFAFGWERVAELEFSFGHTDAALEALNRSLALAPRNPQAMALKGFLLAAQNRIVDAMQHFDEAIAIDGSLGNAWLGRGLCRIRRGDEKGGLGDLEVAAALEPNRAVLRSYLGKAFSQTGDDARANHELELARAFDPNDPTSWLYCALLHQQESRINEAIRDLEKSQELNDNRSVFRSRMLLDQDNAVRSANLATMYDDVGMNDVGVREAAKAVTYDYDNASAHLFLSDSYNALRDPTGFNLRYETAWFNELLLANLLAPVGAGRLSQTLSSQEYSKLFESDGPGFASQSFWRSDGQFNQLAGQYGTYKNTSWAVDLDYQHNNGVRPNNQLDNISGAVTVKQQLTPSDTVMGIVQYENYHSGDNFQYYNPDTSYRPDFEYAEHQAPTVVGGYQHEWAPGIRTLLLGGRLEDRQHFSDIQAPQLALIEISGGTLVSETTEPFDVELNDQLEIYTAEFCQIVQKDKLTLIGGGRWQGGQFNYSDSLVNPPLPPFLLPPVNESFSAPFQRLGGYGYLMVEPVDKLWLTGGVAYDDMKYPSNFRNLPQSAGTDERHQLEPKAAIVWSPFKQATLRGIYSRSLGGVSLDDSYRLEPTELAGFVQAFRSVIPESVVGSVSGEDVELEGLALDLKFSHGTFAGLEVQHMNSVVRQTIGDFLLVNGIAPFVPSTTPQNLNYDEISLSASINQLLPDGFVAGLSYSLTHSELKTMYPQIPVSVSAPQDQSAYLHRIGAYLLFNHPSGLFAEFDAHGYLQENLGYTPAEPGEDFVQLDIEGGWRFYHRRGELLVGVLNLGGQNYHLNPLNVYSELPRSRVFIAQFSFEF